MDVRIKQFNVEMELKTKGIELEVRDNEGNHLGDLCIGKANVEWCKGKTRRGGGKPASWDELIEWFESH
jgi:hypothetical protein